MIIRKQFKFEASHVVRNCTSERCKYSVHGHSFLVDVMLQGHQLDRGGMLYDFGLLKGTVKDFIDGFDHAYLLWNEEPVEYKKLMTHYSRRLVELPFSPSAENLAIMFHAAVEWILLHHVTGNGEDPGLTVKSVRLHETATGYAESEQSDVKSREWALKDIRFSEEISGEWSNPQMWYDILKGKSIHNPTPEQQIVQETGK